MKYTSAQVAKELRRLNDEHHALLSKEQLSREFVASVGEDIESVRPAYDYAAVQAELATLEAEIRRFKHALNRFNTTTEVPGFGMTVDELLVYLPQLSARKQKLSRMKAVLPKTREMRNVSSGNFLDYRYANYDIEAVSAAYDAVAAELSAAQSALDVLNNTVAFEVE